MKLISRTPVLIFVWLFLFSNTVRAASFLPEDRYQQGMAQLKAGHFDEARDQFVRALILKTSYAQAKEQLQALLNAHYRTDGLLYHRYQRFIDLIEYVHFLKDRTRHLTDNNRFLMDFIEKSAPPGSGGTDQEIPPHLYEEINAFSPGVGLSSTGLPQGIFDIRDINRDLLDEKEALIIRLEGLKRLNRKLRDVKLSILRDKMGAARKHITAKTQKMRSEADDKVVRLTNELAAVSLEKYEKEMALADQDKTVHQLEKSLDEARQRLELARHLVDQDAGGEDGGTQNPALQRQMDDLRRKYDLIVSRLNDKDREVHVLAGQIKFQAKELSEFKTASAVRFQQLKDLQGILQIYRERLADASRSLKERDAAVLDLEQQIRQMERRQASLASQPYQDITPGARAF